MFKNLYLKLKQRRHFLTQSINYRDAWGSLFRSAWPVLTQKERLHTGLFPRYPSIWVMVCNISKTLLGFSYFQQDERVLGYAAGRWKGGREIGRCREKSFLSIATESSSSSSNEDFTISTLGWNINEKIDVAQELCLPIGAARLFPLLLVLRLLFLGNVNLSHRGIALRRRERSGGWRRQLVGADTCRQPSICKWLGRNRSSAGSIRHFCNRWNWQFPDPSSCLAAVASSRSCENDGTGEAGHARRRRIIFWIIIAPPVLVLLVSGVQLKFATEESTLLVRVRDSGLFQKIKTIKTFLNVS